MSQGKSLAGHRLLGKSSATAFSKRCGLSLPFVSKVLRGERRPSLPAARRWSDALGITLDEFFKRLYPKGAK